MLSTLTKVHVSLPESGAAFVCLLLSRVFCAPRYLTLPLFAESREEPNVLTRAGDNVFQSTVQRCTPAKIATLYNVFGVSTERYILFLCVFAGAATTWPRETRAAVEVAARMILLKKPGMFHYKGEGKEKRHAPLVVVKWRIALQKMETV